MATYRIVTEAVTNVVRHAGAASCWLTIAAGATVEIDVVDDGVGIDDDAVGVGLAAMRERAAELGGTVDVLPNSPQGTHLHVQAAGGVAVSMPAPLRVAIVDDHPMFRMGLAAAIHEMDGIELVGEAQQAEQVAALVADAAPDVLLLDVRLADASGLEVNRWLAEHHPAVRVIMLTMSEDHDTALTALRDGASGYLVKGPGPSGSSTPCGRSPPATSCSISPWPRPSPSWPRPAGRRPAGRSPSSPSASSTSSCSSPRGLDNHTIARRLVLSPKTVRNHVSNVFAKIQATDRPHAIVLARRPASAPDSRYGRRHAAGRHRRAGNDQADRRPRRASTPGATTASASSSSRCTTRPTRRSGTA